MRSKDLTHFEHIRDVKPIEEELHEGLKTIAMSNFSNALEAAAEIIDNSVDEKDPQQKPLLLKIRISPGIITFLDSNTLGMGYKELNEFLKWGFSSKSFRTDAIGKYGAGGKGAIGYLGSGCTIRTKRKGEDVEWEISETNWRNPSRKALQPTHRKSRYNINLGFTQIDIFGVDRRINKNQLAEMISHFYKSLLENEELDVRIGKSTLKKLEPFKPPLDEKFPIEKFETNSKFGSIKGWVGRLAPKTGLRGGIRCYYRGRLITKDYKKAQEFFGHPDPQSLGSLNFLIGEVHLNFVPVLPNKTDFDRQSKEWEEIHEIMHKILHPHVEQLKSRREEVEITAEDLLNLSQVSNLVFKAIENIEKEKVPFGSVPSNGDLEGRKSPESKAYDEKTVARESQQSRDTYNPSSPPPINSVGRLKRTYGSMKFDVREGDGLSRAAVIHEEGEKILVIYKKYPEYLERGPRDILYKAESAVLQLEKPEENESITIDSYLDKVDRVMAEVIKLYNLSKKHKGKIYESEFIGRLEAL